MSKETKVLFNDTIQATQVRLIHSEGMKEPFNKVMDLHDALSIAESENLDLVQINDLDVPVVKLMDANKYIYDLKQKEKQKQKVQREKTIQVKEIQLSIDIQSHDLEVKRKKADKFLLEGKHVKITLKLFGRMRGNKGMQEAALRKTREFMNSLAPHDVHQGSDILSDVIAFVIKPQL